MRLLRIRLTNFRGVADRELTFAESGVTVVEGPNESGKSSTIEAFGLLLDELDSSRKEAVRAVKPRHSDASPEVEAEFRVGGHHLVYRKRWLRPLTELRILAPAPQTLTGREAHERVLAILNQATDYDLFKALRVLQDKPFDVDRIASSVSLRAALDAAAGGAGPSDGTEDTLVERVEKEFARYFTPGKHQPTGEYRAAQEAHAAAVREADELGALLDRVEADAERHGAVSARLAELQRRLVTDRAEAEEFRRRAAAVQTLRARRDEAAALVERAERDAELAAKAWEARRDLVDRVGRHADELARVRADLAAHAELRTAADARRAGALAMYQAADEAHRLAQRRYQEADADYRWKRDEHELERIVADRRALEEADRDVAAAQAEQAATEIDDRLVEAIDAADREVRAARTAIEVAAATVRVERLGEAAVTVAGSVAGVTEAGAGAAAVPGARAESDGSVDGTGLVSATAAVSATATATAVATATEAVPAGGGGSATAPASAADSEREATFAAPATAPAGGSVTALAAADSASEATFAVQAAGSATDPASGATPAIPAAASALGSASPPAGSAATSASAADSPSTPAPATPTPVPPGEPVVRRITDPLVIEASGVLRVTLSPGASERELRAGLDAAESELATLCRQAGVRDLASARVRLQRHAEARASLRAAETARDKLSKDPSALADEQARLEARIADHLERRDPGVLPPADRHEAETVAERRRAESEETAANLALLAGALRSAEEETNRLAAEAENLRGRADSLLAEHQAAQARLAEARAAVSDEAVESRDAEAAKALATAVQDRAVHDAEYRRAEPEQVELLLGNARAVVARTEAEITEARAELHHLAGRLDTVGDDVADRRREADRRRDAAERELTAVTARAEAAALLHETLLRRRAEATESYQGPFKEQVEKFGRWVFGATFGVTVDSELRISHRTLHGRTDPYPELSTGAREAVAMCVRLACAALVGPDGGVPVLIDDALGAADPGRRRNLGALLAHAGDQGGAEGAQIIIFTCDPDRYRAVGSAQVRSLVHNGDRENSPAA